MRKLVALLFILNFLLYGCDITSSTSTTPQQAPIDPVAEEVFATSLAGLLARLEQETSVIMGGNSFLDAVLSDQYLNAEDVRVYELRYKKWKNTNAEYIGSETIDIYAHLGCPCETPDDFLGSRGECHPTLEIRFFYGQGGESLLTGSAYERVDEYADVYCYSSADNATLHYLVLMSSNYACRFSIDMAFKEHDILVEDIIKYVLSL